MAPVNETDMVLLPEGLKALKQVAKEVGVDLVLLDKLVSYSLMFFVRKVLRRSI